MIKVLDDKFWEQFGITEDDKASSNKILTESGVGFVYGKPATRKTTIVLDTVKSMEFDDKIYIDCDSKSLYQAKDIYKNLTKVGFVYRNPVLEDREPLILLGSILKDIEKMNDISKKRCIIIDTWYQLINKENDNEEAKSIMEILRKYSQKYNILIVLIAHVGHQNDDIRGASSVSDDATFKVLLSKSDIPNQYAITITKDSLGLLSDSIATVSNNSSVSASTIKYSRR